MDLTQHFRGKNVGFSGGRMEDNGRSLWPRFWDARGIIHINYEDKGQTTNKDFYELLQDRSSRELKKDRSHLTKRKSKMPYNNHTQYSTYGRSP